MRTRTIEKKLNPFWCEEFTLYDVFHLLSKILIICLSEVQNTSKAKIILTVVDEKKYH